MSMNPEQKELTFDESIKQVMQTLPPPIRRYLSEGKYTAVAHRLTSKYALHSDQENILERELMLLLMGIETPDQFSSVLTDEAHIAEDNVLAIMTDINQEIFASLREEMEKGKDIAGVQKSVAPTSQPVASVSSQQSPPLSESNKEGTPESYFHLENKIPRSTTPPTQNVSTEFGTPPHLIKDFEQQPLAPTPQPRSSSRIAPLPPKAIMPHKDQSYDSSFPPTRKRKPLTAPQPLPPVLDSRPPVSPPQNLPGVMSPAPKASINRLSSQQPQSNQTPDSADVDTYSADPYREPVEEN